MNSYLIGDKVAWETPQGLHTGMVVERCTEAFNLGRQRITASEDKPFYIVQCDATAARAAHPPEGLRPSPT